jgi:hypothetical protein
MKNVTDITCSDWIILRVMREMVRTGGMEKALRGNETTRAVLWLCNKYGMTLLCEAMKLIDMARREEDKQYIERACRVGSTLMGDEPPIECMITELMENDF